MTDVGGSAATVGATDGAGVLAVPRRLPLRPDGTRLVRLSVSSLKLFWRCPERWRRRYIEGFEEPKNAPMIVGSAVGAAVTAHYHAQIVGEPLSRKDADDLCLIEFDQLAPSAVFDGEKRKDRLAERKRAHEEGRVALAAYLDDIAPGVWPCAVERRIELEFSGAEWRFVCYLDLEDDRGPVIDLKVVGNHVSQESADVDSQGTGYLLARLMEGDEATRFDFHSVRRGTVKKGPRCKAVSTKRTKEQLAAFERRVAQTAREIDRCHETGDWPLSSPEGWWCGAKCPHFAKCPGGGLR